MACQRKQEYMQIYNQRSQVKAKKAEYMRGRRAEAAKLRSREAVYAFLEAGFENQAFEYAKEFAPDMLLTIEARKPIKQRA